MTRKDFNNIAQGLAEAKAEARLREIREDFTSKGEYTRLIDMTIEKVIFQLKIAYPNFSQDKFWGYTDKEADRLVSLEYSGETC